MSFHRNLESLLRHLSAKSITPDRVDETPSAALVHISDLQVRVTATGCTVAARSTALALAGHLEPVGGSDVTPMVAAAAVRRLLQRPNTAQAASVRKLAGYLARNGVPVTEATASAVEGAVGIVRVHPELYVEVWSDGAYTVMERQSGGGPAVRARITSTSLRQVRFEIEAWLESTDLLPDRAPRAVAPDAPGFPAAGGFGVFDPAGRLVALCARPDEAVTLVAVQGWNASIATAEGTPVWWREGFETHRAEDDHLRAVRLVLERSRAPR